MHAPSAMALLDIWERGRAQGPLQRAMLLLAAAYPSTPPGELGQMPIGRRDALLLALREATFGSRIASVAPCPQCHEQLELAFGHADLPSHQFNGDAPQLLEVDGYALRFRCINSDDLAALGTGNASLPEPRLALFGRCVLEARRAEARIAVEHLPAQVLEALEAHLARADLGADLRIAVECPACGHRWQALFDIVSFFWSEIESWACRLLHEVHALASAYGWSEREILALSPFRRRCYLDMVGA